jgi:Na+/H+-dicarboxylate symporter
LGFEAALWVWVVLVCVVDVLVVVVWVVVGVVVFVLRGGCSARWSARSSASLQVVYSTAEVDSVDRALIRTETE